MFIDMFPGCAVSVSEQLDVRPVFIYMFIGSVVSVSKQIRIRTILIDILCSAMSV